MRNSTTSAAVGLAALGLFVASAPVTSQAAAPRIDPQLKSVVHDIVSVGVSHDFQPGRAPDRDMIRFAIYATQLRNPDMLFTDPTTFDTRISAQNVSAAVKRYFGESVKHQPVEKWKYRNGYYIGDATVFEQPEFEPIKKLSVASGPGSQLTVYTDTLDTMASDAYDRPVVVKAKMTFKTVNAGGRKRYVLTSYRKLSKHG